MTVQVILEIADRKINEIVTGRNADDILTQAQARVARELGWKGLFVKAMTPLGFAQEAVRRYNGAHDTQYAVPQNAEEFLALGQDLGYLKVLSETENDTK